MHMQSMRLTLLIAAGDDDDCWFGPRGRHHLDCQQQQHVSTLNYTVCCKGDKKHVAAGGVFWLPFARQVSI